MPKITPIFSNEKSILVQNSNTYVFTSDVDLNKIELCKIFKKNNLTPIKITLTIGSSKNKTKTNKKGQKNSISRKKTKKYFVRFPLEQKIKENQIIEF